MLILTDNADFRAGLNYYSQEEYFLSVEYFMKFAAYQHNKGRNMLRYSFWSFWNNLAGSFTMLSMFPKAETCFNNAIKCFNNSKPMKDTGVVFFNYACMLFFYKKDSKDLYKAYFLFNLADKVGFKNIFVKKINEQFVKNVEIYQESLSYFYQSRLFYQIQNCPYLRSII